MFNKKWFEKHQKILLWLLNKPVIKTWFRYCLQINCKTKINRIEPNAYWFDGKMVGEKIEIKVEFKETPKYSNRIFYAFYPIWWLAHQWDTLFANEYKPAWNLGFDTLTQYPGSTGANNPIDGWVARHGVNQTFADIIAGAGTLYDDSSANAVMGLYSTSTTDQYSAIYRFIDCFDTSSLTADATISNATLSHYGSGKANGLGSPDFHVCASTPASTSALANSDFGNLGSTSFGSVAYASWSTTGYNDITLNASGIANISKTGISKFGCRLSWDIGGSFGGVWKSNDNSGFEFYSAKQTGTTNDPKLVVTYTLPSVSNFFFFY